jgi:hypothetical protein
MTQNLICEVVHRVVRVLGHIALVMKAVVSITSAVLALTPHPATICLGSNSLGL